MAPNSEEDSQIKFTNKRSWGLELMDKEPLRPPVYNPEDYAASLKKWGKKGSMGIQVPQYLSQSTGSLEKFSEEMSHLNKRQSSPSIKSSSSNKSGDEKQSKKEKELTLKMEKKDLKNKENIKRGLKSDLQKDFLNPILNLSAQNGEMSLRQFSSVTELLGKLKVDLKLSFPSFVQEFVGDPIDGITLLLELLRAVQLSQTSQLQRCPPQILRRALLDEHSCLICLKYCLRCSDASRRLASSPAGLFTLAVCIMSNVTQSRVIALELLTKACEPLAGGHKAVSEALSTLRLRFGEPVRFRFLVGMLSSAGAIELLAAAMKFINAFVDSAPNLQQKVYIQAELEQAGFDSEILRKTLPSNSENVKLELNKWEKNYFNVEKLNNKVAEVNVLYDKIHLLEKRIKILQEEKGILQSLEQCLKERCSELEEISIETTTTANISSSKPFRNCRIQQSKKNVEKVEPNPPEDEGDEGISSSEQELSQDEDYIKGGISYINSNELEERTHFKTNRSTKQARNEPIKCMTKSPEPKMTSKCNLKNLKNIRSNIMKESNVDDGNEIIPRHAEEEEETTIDEVIEELKNIVNDAEIEAYASEEKVKISDQRSPIPSIKCAKELNPAEKYRTYNARQSFIWQEKTNFEESEIIPAVLHPQPPKKAKSLVHIYFPGSDFDSQDRQKSEFFEDDTDTESSDSLLIAAQEKKSLQKGSHNSLEVSDSCNSFSTLNTRGLFIKQDQEFEEGELNPRLCYEERNIDEEEIKRKHLKTNAITKKENIQTGSSETEKSQKVQNSHTMTGSNEKLNKFSHNHEASTFLQAAKKSFPDRISNENLVLQTPKLAPTPVKRSQTFHTTSTGRENMFKKTEPKPKPKMGVSGLDFQRISEQKVPTDNWRYQVFEYKKNLEKRVNANDRYSKKISKEFQKNHEDEKSDGTESVKRGSFSRSSSVTKTQKDNTVAEPVFRKYSFSALEKSSSMVRSKSVEKMDEGLDLLVDIIISTDEKPKPRSEWNPEVTKNIGPRTRRSLAESILFCPQYAKNFNKSEESLKPPKPAQRTSLTRNNSSSTLMHSPSEVKLAPAQVKPQQQMIYTVGLKPAKSESSLLASSEGKRCPPDGSSNSTGFKKKQENQTFFEDEPLFHSSPAKQNKIQTFFGNPKFENEFFESNYAAAANKKPASPSVQTAREVQSSGAKFKGQLLNCNQKKVKSIGCKELGVNPTHSKPNFLLGTYQSQSSRNNASMPKINGSVLQSINIFNNNSFMNRSNALSNLYSGIKKNSESNNFSTKVRSADLINNKPVNCSAKESEKVTDSPSGLY